MTIKLVCTCGMEFNSVEECRKWHEENNKEIIDSKHSFKFNGEVEPASSGAERFFDEQFERILKK